MGFIAGNRRANESRILQVEFLVFPPHLFGSLGRFTTTSGVFLLFAYQLAVIDMSLSITAAVDGSFWLSQYRGLPFLGRTGYLSKLAQEELAPWKSKIDASVAERYARMFELLDSEDHSPNMADFDVDGYRRGFKSTNR
jgi:hypothetical protein